MVVHDINNISSLQLRPFSPSSGSCPFLSPTSNSQIWYVLFRSCMQQMPREDQELEVSVRRIHTDSVNSQNLHRQLEVSRAREQKLDADLLVSEQERERLIETLE